MIDYDDTYIGVITTCAERCLIAEAANRKHPRAFHDTMVRLGGRLSMVLLLLSDGALCAPRRKLGILLGKTW